jgi:hypothetical protein
LRATAAALRALRYLGGDLKNRAACEHFVIACAIPTGGFADVPGRTADVVSSAAGLMALAELKRGPDHLVHKTVSYLDRNARSFEEIRMAAAGMEAAGRQSAESANWIKQLIRERRPDGTFGEASVGDTAGRVVTLLRLGASLPPIGPIVATLRAGQRADGGFGKDDSGSDLETTYRVMRAFAMLKCRPLRPDRVAVFVAACRDADHGYALRPGLPSQMAPTYFASAVLRWLAEP